MGDGACYCVGILASLVPVRSLLFAIFILMLGAGFLTTLVSILLQASNTGPLIIGLIATSYFAGLAAGAVRVGRLVAPIEHIRTLP